MIYEVFSVPFKISQEIEITWNIIVFDVSADIIFLINIILTFFVPVYDKNGKLIYNKKKIAKMYLKLWFWPDLIVCIPFTLLWHLREND
jgi:hypothetical protein